MFPLQSGELLIYLIKQEIGEDGVSSVKFETAQAVFYVLTFLVPGFITDGVLSSFQTRKSEEFQVTLLRLFTFSVINYAVWSWLIYLLVFTQYFKEHEIGSAVLWLCIILIAPIILAIALGYASQKEWSRKFYQSIGLRTKHITPTGWDWHFEQQRREWVLITLNDGSTVSGLFEHNSYASSDPSERDLYVEQLYKIDDEGNWLPDIEGKGILVAGVNIKTIESWPVI